MTDQVESSSSPSQSPRFLKTPLGKVGMGLLVIVALVLVALQQTYRRPVDDPLVRTMARLLPLPAVSVGEATVSMREFLVEYDALARYFEDQGGGMAPADLEVAIADTVVNKLAIRELARVRGVVVDTQRVEEYYQDVVASQESEEAFLTELGGTFGWSKEEFKARIVESIVLALQMSDAVLADEAQQAVRRSTIDAAYARVEGGEEFALVAKDVHAGFGGNVSSDLGYVKQSQMPATWAQAVLDLEEGAYTRVQDLPEGFVIFQVTERIAAGEDTQVHLLAITVPKKTLEEMVGEYLDGVEVKRYVGET